MGLLGSQAQVKPGRTGGRSFPAHICLQDHSILTHERTQQVPSRTRRPHEAQALVAVTTAAKPRQNTRSIRGERGAIRRPTASFGHSAARPVRSLAPAPCARHLLYCQHRSSRPYSLPGRAPPQPACSPLLPLLQPDGHPGCPLQPSRRRHGAAAAALRHQRARSKERRARPAAGARVAASV